MFLEINSSTSWLCTIITSCHCRSSFQCQARVLMCAVSTDAFTQLQEQVLQLSTTFFNHPPRKLPPEILEQIPSSIPPFLSDSPSCRHLCAAYVAHSVSRIINARVFTP